MIPKEARPTPSSTQLLSFLVIVMLLLIWVIFGFNETPDPAVTGEMHPASTSLPANEPQ